MKGTCKAGYYKANSVITHGPLVCFGGFGQPQCEYLAECLEANKEAFGPRRFKRMMKKI